MTAAIIKRNNVLENWLREVFHHRDSLIPWDTREKKYCFSTNRIRTIQNIRYDLRNPIDRWVSLLEKSIPKKPESYTDQMVTAFAEMKSS